MAMMRIERMETRQDVFMPCIENRASGGTEIRNASVCAQVMTGRRSTLVLLLHFRTVTKETLICFV